MNLDTCSFKDMFEGLKANKQVDASKIPDRLLTLDPGETTGWAKFQGLELVLWGQINTSTPENSHKNLKALFDTVQPTKVVMESYHVYEWKAKDHSWNPLMTVRVIGMIEFLCIDRIIPISRQTAQVGKGFMTDERLHQFGFYQKGQRHARDAIRHGCQYILFHSDMKP